MTPEAYNRARQIQRRLAVLEGARLAWDDHAATGFAQLCALLGEDGLVMCGDAPKPGSVAAAPVMRFRSSCLDWIATKEAALKAEMEAL